jgi:hypothetical protein
MNYILLALFAFILFMQDGTKALVRDATGILFREVTIVQENLNITKSIYIFLNKDGKVVSILPREGITGIMYISDDRVM